MMYQLIITLQSDLCAADSDGFASAIDTDVVTDAHGIPYIPARRLKGCLREAAKYIESPLTDRIFGVKGSMTSGSLHIRNARIEGYEAVLEEVQKLANAQEPDEKLTAQSVTELFAQTVASTAVSEEGSAKENSLRFVRTVSGTTPWDPGKPLVFLADVEIDTDCAAEFKRICRALRHIGYKRSRGFGAVSCRLVETETASRPALPEIRDDNRRYTLTYAIRLDEPLMLPGKALDETRDYVSGQQVIGALAGAYLKEHPADAAFEALFLSDAVRFSNLYLTDTEFRTYIPVPQYLGKSKLQEDRNKLLLIPEEARNNPDKIIKPIKSGYISKGFHVINAKTERIYHNAVNSNTESKLYTQNCLQSGQFLRGTITAPGTQLRTILTLLKTAPLRFGRSKTAQYAQCSLVSAYVSPEVQKTVVIPAGKYIVYALTSDAILLDEYGSYDTSYEALCKALDLAPEQTEKAFCVLKYTTLHGFHTVTGLQKAQIRAIAAGSIIVAKADQGSSLRDTMYIGEQQNAGFGQVKIFPADALLENETEPLAPMQKSAQENAAIRAYFEDLSKKEKMECTAVAYAQEVAAGVKKEAAKINSQTPAFLGRITLMVKQSASREDLDSRIQSIKSDDKRVTADELIKEADPGQFQQTDWAFQKRYLLIILTILKYRMKAKGLETGKKEAQ